jgi:hypothetical protein
VKRHTALYTCDGCGTIVEAVGAPGCYPSDDPPKGWESMKLCFYDSSAIQFHVCSKACVPVACRVVGERWCALNDAYEAKRLSR